MENQENTRVVTLKDLWELLIQRLPVIVLAAVIAVSGLFVMNLATYDPEYESTAMLYILRQGDDSTSSGDASNDFSLALKVVNDCTYLLKSHTVLDAVIDELELDTDYKELYKTVSTRNPDNTRILEVTVRAESPELAKQIVDKICELGKESITKAMGFEQVNLFEYGRLEKLPCNKMSILVYAIVAVAAAVLTYSVYMVLYLLDDGVRTSEDIERYLGISVLGEIPDAKESVKNGNAYVYGRETVRKGKKGEA